MDKIIGKQLPKKDQDNEHWVLRDPLIISPKRNHV